MSNERTHLKVVGDLISELRKIEPNTSLFDIQVTSLFEQIMIDMIDNMNDLSDQIETGEFDKDTPLPLTADLKDPEPYIRGIKDDE